MPDARTLSYWLIVILAALIGGFLIYRTAEMPVSVTVIQNVATATPVLSVNATTTPTPPAKPSFQFEIVTDLAAQERGLGGRAEVPQHYGMLFVFPTDDYYGFWMKDMLVPIDMIWLSDNGIIVKIDASVATSTYPSVFYPPQPVRYVLETAAGETVREGWVIGTQLTLPLHN